MFFQDRHALRLQVGHDQGCGHTVTGYIENSYCITSRTGIEKVVVIASDLGLLFMIHGQLELCSHFFRSLRKQCLLNLAGYR